MLDLVTSIFSVWLVTVTVQFEETDRSFSTYNKEISFQQESFCKIALERTEPIFEQSFLEYWNSETNKEELKDLTINQYSFACKEWYLAADGEWYMMGQVPTIET